jgi:hypothetical protein
MKQYVYDRRTNVQHKMLLVKFLDFKLVSYLNKTMHTVGQGQIIKFQHISDEGFQQEIS